MLIGIKVLAGKHEEKGTGTMKNGKRQQHTRNIHGITSCSEMTDKGSQPQLCNSLLMDLDLGSAYAISMA